MLAGMELRHLRYFVAVAGEENVSRAALKLHLSQPALSRQIRDLEEAIGFQLLERTAKSVRLTAAGKVFLAEAREVLLHAEAAVSKARMVASGTSRELSVGYAPSLTVEILPRALRQFQEQFPKVRLALHDLSSAELLAQLREGKLQVALTVRPAEKALRGLNFTELARYEICAAVAPRHPLARLKSISLAQLAGEPLMAYSQKDYPEYHKALKIFFRKSGNPPRLAGEHDGITSLIAAVESGRGFALVPDCVATLAGARLKLLPLRPAWPSIFVGALWCNDPAADLAEHFISAALPKSDRK